MVRNGTQNVKSSTRYYDDIRQQILDIDTTDHSAIMPMLDSAVKSPDADNVYDTAEYYKDENVSLGFGTTVAPVTL